MTLITFRNRYFGDKFLTVTQHSTCKVFSSKAGLNGEVNITYLVPGSNAKVLFSLGHCCGPYLCLKNSYRYLKYLNQNAFQCKLKLIYVSLSVKLE